MTLFKTLAALFLLSPSLAWATGIESVYAALQYVYYAAVAYSVYSTYESGRKARAASRKAKEEYNSKLQDRSIIAVRSDPPWRIIYGDAIVGGEVLDIFTTDDDQYFESNGSIGVKPDGLKHLVIALAAHECEAITDIMLDGIPIGTPGPDGWIVDQTARDNGFVKESDQIYTLVFTGSGTFPYVPSSITKAYSDYTPGVDSTWVDRMGDISWTPGTNTITGPEGVQISVDYTVHIIQSMIRVSKHLGTDTQAVDSYLNSVAPSRYTAAHQLKNHTYVSVTLRLIDDRFQSGIPGLTFRVLGKKLYDPRTGLTKYSDNNALVVNDYLQAVFGLGADVTDVDETYTIAAANDCDTRADATSIGYSSGFVFDVATSTLVFPEDQWWTRGDGVRLTSPGTFPTPLSSGTTYYMVPFSGSRVFKLASSVSDALASSTITFGGTESGTVRANVVHSSVTYTYPVVFNTNTSTLVFANIPYDTDQKPLWTRGDTVTITASGSLPSPLSVGTTYYLIPSADSKQIRLGASLSDANSGVNIVFSGPCTSQASASWFDYALYTCNGSFTTAENREQILTDLVQSMAGRAVYGGQWQISAGTWSAPVMDLDDTDLCGQIEMVTSDLSLEDLLNGVRGQYISSGRVSPTDYDDYLNPVFVSVDGEQLWDNIDFPYTNHKQRASNLSRIYVESSRAAQTLRYPAKMRAWPLQVGDRVRLTSLLYGITSKYYRVTEWQFGVTSAVELTLVEDSPEVWDLADATVPDQNPNTDIVNPYRGYLITGLEAESGAEWSTVQDDGSVVAKVHVQWNPITDIYVIEGGVVELAWRYAGNTVWTAFLVDGNVTETVFSGVNAGWPIIVRARTRNRFGIIGPNAFTTLVVHGDEGPPDDVVNLQQEIKPGQAVVSWNRCQNIDYLRTELRLGASWDSAPVMWSGNSTDFKVARPPNGTYHVMAKHVDRSGNYSVNAVAVDVVVDDSIDGGTGGKVVLEADGNFFSFANETTHTSVSPNINFTLHALGLVGAATWSARAFNAISGGTDIGPVTMTTNGNGATMSAAQFVAPGTSGSVRRVEVTASISSQSDFRIVYRLDPTVSSPVLWLSDERVVIPADANGQYPVLTDASTYAAVYVGNGTSILDKTNVHTWSISADAGITCTINGSAGPVVNPASVLLQITAMTIPSGVVHVTATPVSGPALTATWYLDISSADGSGWNAYWQPSSLSVPVNADGSVATFDGAYSDVFVLSVANQVNDTANWTKAITTRNVTASMTGARAQILSWLPLGQVSAGAVIPATLHASWTRADWPIYTPRGNWLQPGYNNGAPWATVRRATAYDAVPWTDIAVPSGRWTIGDASRDTIILGEVTGSSNRYIRSVDDGLTWIEETLPSGAQRVSWIHTGAEWLVSSHGSTAGYRSVTGVAGTWSAVTMPGLGCQLAGGAGVVLATTSMGVQFYSVNGGVNWLPMADGYSGAAAFKGRLYTVMSGDPTKMLVWDGGRWVKQALPASAAGFSGLLVIRDVLYLIAGGNIMYTSDGLTWRAGGSGASTLGAWVRSGSRALMVDFIPHTNTEHSASNWAVWKPLLSTSDTVGSVTVQLTKPGEEDIFRTLMVYKGSAPRVTYIASADPADCPVPATSDGRVTSFANAVITGNIKADGVDVTSLYAITWQTTYLTPSSGSGAVCTITGMSDSQPVGYIDWQAVRSGYPVVTGRTQVRKVYGTEPGGPVLRRSFTVFGLSATYVALKFSSDGWWYTKVGSSGSWIAQDRWVIGFDPTTFWINMRTPPEGPFTSGTVDTWQQMTADRIYTFSDSSPGVHVRTVTVGMNSSATDVGAGWGGGKLQLEVL